ncbi:MAG: hypothetical protein HY720_25850 [Planctomycetes bacterium]|nr:hypothetical protein [Planctomycetota bacterium]
MKRDRLLGKILEILFKEDRELLALHVAEAYSAGPPEPPRFGGGSTPVTHETVLDRVRNRLDGGPEPLDGEMIAHLIRPDPSRNVPCWSCLDAIARMAKDPQHGAPAQGRDDKIDPT